MPSRVATSRGTLDIYSFPWYQSLPQWAWGIVALGSAVGLASPHPLLSLACWGALPILVSLTWRTGEPPVALVGVLILWAKSIVPVVYFSDIKGLPLQEISGSYATRFSTAGLETASWLALGAVLVVAVGIRLGLNQVPPVVWKRLRAESERLDIQKLLLTYGAVYVLNFVFGGGNLLGLGGLAQLALAATLIRWAIFFLLASAVLVQQRQYLFFALVITVEMGLGLIGFWGNFRDFFFIFAIAYVSARPRMTLRRAWILITVFLLVFVVGLFWQSVKPAYRNFLTQGQGGMSVRVSYSQQAEKMWKLVRTTEWEHMAGAMDKTVQRISINTFFFGEVVEYIPKNRPYDGGKGWMRAIEHVLKPRLFFPNKPVLNDSKITNRYIGMTMTEQGASFSIGYFGESYADFGPFLMFIPVFLVGVMFGLMYRFFIQRSHVKIIGFALATAFLPAIIGGLDDIPSLLGLSITHFVAMAAVLYLGESFLYSRLRRS